ncbi:hypothetical protein PF005_g4743 [Phytophthora fragariae]|uniref:Knl1 C-terminal RWD domain-containing protein n=1 Tax=Phytophthora fragariae TaxID=53985 RepID=A0A6A3FLR2_9STRA|nr:hypothetical protein PF003_g215 [Phytophthora fragariae]KAE8945261.1 hypothetical protein PF009_g5092 [Phytophthora fragariae]KAE9024508.1 hypothetical protein PF011_g3478 [Phytophthora fragariae]KAE9129729.1 hypothetical protein PF007_g4780 [Phytophthora fragariae]KAE9129946.1 hypothetical protein PF010_g4014 [Phytophthora fragariae]
MADADGVEDSDYELSLSAPASRRRETITRQLQREILREMAAEQPQEEQEQEQERKTEDDDPDSVRRRTLSPSKAALLLQDVGALDASISRRDTVSPQALKAVLRVVEQQEEQVERVEPSLESGRTESEELLQDTHTPPPTSSSPPAAAVQERRKSVSTSDSFTDFMFAPNLLEKDAANRATLDPTEAASVVAALQKEVRSLSSSTLEVEESDSDGDNQKAAAAQPKESKIKAPTPLRELVGKKTPPSVKQSKRPLAPVKETNKSKSPSPANEAKSKKTPSPSKEAKSRKSPSPAKEAKGRKSPTEPKSRKSPAPAKQPRRMKSPTPTKSNSNRRATVDPSDVLMMLEGKSQQEDVRRQTIDENGLLELTSALESTSADGKQGEEVSRKRVNDSDVREGSPDKRARSHRDDNDDQAMESMEIDSPVRTKESSPSPRQAATSSNQTQDKLQSSAITNQSLFSPPPTGTRVRTPLKGILSARKAKRDAGGAVHTTPTKTVNFGPSQGAEFNHGSPSTSMTPMLAKDVSRRYPSEPPPSSEEEPDDAETSLNSSILDEADSFDEEEEEEPKEIIPPKVTLVKKSGFDLLASRRSSLMAPKSIDKSRRRQSLRGYSPLDSQTEARRRRRQTINIARQTSSKPMPSFAAADKSISSSQSPSFTRNNSFLRATDVAQSTRMPYADSSASSDAGEDMEITGDYSFVLGHDSIAPSKPAPSSAGMPRDEDTAEFSLGHLLAESSVYELTKSAPASDLHDLPGTLGDLASEFEDVPSNQASQVVNSSQRLNDQDNTLDPIREGDETMTSSRGQSMMSLVSSDDSDEEYGTHRKSINVNLTPQFERASIDGEPRVTSQAPATTESLSVHLITMEELLSSVMLDENMALVETYEDFFGEEAESTDYQISTSVKLASAYDTCSEVIERHGLDISSWSAAVTEELSSLLQIEAPGVFSPENLDDAGREAIRELYATEAMVAQSGWLQLQAQMEKQLASSLSLGADALANDVKTLKSSVSSDTLKRQNELAAIKEMIDREEQMALLLDAIEEQQGAHDEYVTAVKDLEKECSSLSLEESVLQSRLKVLEGRAAELEPVTAAAATLYEQEVLATEEMLAIQESMTVWKIREATASLLRVSARFEDVLFHVELNVDVRLGPPSTGGASTSIKVNETLKQREHNTYLPIEGDVVLVLQRLLLDPHYISRIADESELGDGNDGRVCSKLQVLEHFINRSFRLLKELRELSTHFAMRFVEDDSTLWIDFLKFPSSMARMNVEGAHFSVGFSLLPVFPYTDYQTDVQVPHGQISTEDVTKEIELVPREAPRYFTRVCRRLHESFVR